jgi:hypothetical protein
MHRIQQGVREFMLTSGMTVDQFNARQIVAHTALQLEEIAQKIFTIADGSIDSRDKATLCNFARHANTIAHRFKLKLHLGDVMRCEHCELVDADFNLAFVSLGALYSVSTDGDKAIDAGCSFNFAQFVTDSVVHNNAGWRKPDFSKFVQPKESTDES